MLYSCTRVAIPQARHTSRPLIAEFAIGSTLTPRLPDNNELRRCDHEPRRKKKAHVTPLRIWVARARIAVRAVGNLEHNKFRQHITLGQKPLEHRSTCANLQSRALLGRSRAKWTRRQSPYRAASDDLGAPRPPRSTTTKLHGGLKGTLNIEVRLVTPSAVNIVCPKGCQNWGKNGLLGMR